MKITSLFIAVVAALSLATSASALSLNDASYIGSVYDGSPSGDTNDLTYLRFLVLMNESSTLQRTNLQLGVGGSDSEVHDFTRSANDFGTLPLPILPASSPAGLSFNVAGFSYAYAKYGENGYAWYLGDLTGVVTLPDPLSANINGSGLSHYTLFAGSVSGNPTDVDPVPDSGSTVLLLGLGCLGVWFVRSRMTTDQPA